MPAAAHSYSDRYTSSALGIYTAPVEDFFFYYIKPQETGNRAGVRWVTLNSGTTYGLAWPAIWHPSTVREADRAQSAPP